MLTCPHCGAANEDGAFFCQSCNRTILSVPSTSTGVAGPPRAVPPAASGAPGVPPPPPPPPPGGVRLPPLPPPPPPSPALPPLPPPGWIPPAWAGQAIHCSQCNTLISAVAVVCPVCGGRPVPPNAADAGDAPRE
ncbi:MAG: zinc ribbon domain-containing protein [Thermoplasmata archaeon]|nr:zinc ribbon domain-containing protein [Thermoplasmata archaeon]